MIPVPPLGHELKTWPAEFADVASGAKRVELRYNDRGYRVGDMLLLREYDPHARTVDPGAQQEAIGRYTGRSCARWVTHVVPGGQWGLSPDWVALSLAETPPAEGGWLV